MKTKTVILGICAFVLAIGSAFTSRSSMATDYKIDLLRGPVPGVAGCPGTDTWFNCTTITSPNACAATGGATCLVTVSSSGLIGGSADATTKTNVASCVAITNSSSAPITTYVDNCVKAVQ